MRSPDARRLLAPLVTALLVVAACSSGGDGGATDERPARTDRRPNVVVVITDDQAVSMMPALRRTRELVGDAGTVFSGMTTAMPLCCPARASLLTGQYPHSNGVVDNLPPAGGFTRLDWEKTVATELQADGYRTAHLGRTLNDYTIDARPLVPPGWDEWYAPLEDNTRSFIAYGADMVANGELVSIGSLTQTDDALGAIALDVLDRWAPADQPFYMEVGTVAPHSAKPEVGGDALLPVPAERHLDTLPGTTPPEVAGPDGPGKPAWVADQQDRVGPRLIRDYWQRAMESLLAVDEMVESIVARLERAGVLDDTIIMVTSDNGILLGEHGLALDKVLPYEGAVNVPLLIRGPGFPAGETSDLPVSQVDIAPTILAAAGIEVPARMEGVPIQEALADPDRAARRALLVESTPTPRPAPPFVQVRSGELVLTRYDTGEAELSDLAADPGQLANVIDDPAYAADLMALDGLLERLRDCTGTACVAYDDEVRP